MDKKDVAIIGAGLAGIFAAHELSMQCPDLDIVVLEQGRAIAARSCPIVEKKTKQCIGCVPCAIMRGFGGAGAFSDGKFNFTTEFGGWLTDYLDHDTVMGLIDDVDKVNQKFGATDAVYTTFSAEAEQIGRAHV